MPSERRLRIYLDGNPVGTARQTAQEAMSFVYDDDYRADRGATPLSLSMPLAADRHRAQVIGAFLDGLPGRQAIEWVAGLRSGSAACRSTCSLVAR